MIRKRAAAAILAAWATCGAAWGWASGPVKAKRGNMPELLVVTRQWPPLVAVRIFIGGGAALDPPGKEGQTLLGWLAALRGTASRDRAQLQAAFDDVAASPGVAVEKSGTWLSADCSADNLPKLLEVIAEVVQHPRFDPAQVQAQRDELLADIAQLRDDDMALCDDALPRYLHRGQAHGRPTQGTPQSLAAVRAEDLAAWHARQIGAGNLIVGFAGAIDKETAERLTAAAFADLPNKPVPKPAAGKIVQDGRRLLLIDKGKRSQVQMNIALSTVGRPHKDMPALLVANAVLGGPFTSRLTRDVRDLRGWAYHADASLIGGASHSIWAATLGTSPADAVPALELVVKIWEELARHGITAAELKFAKDWLLGGRQLAMETATAELGNAMAGRALGMDAAEIAALPAKIAALDLKTVQKVIKERLKPEHLVAVVVGPAAVLRDKLLASAAQFAVEEIAADAAPELTSGAGRAVVSKPLPAEATGTSDRAEPDPDGTDEGEGEEP